MIRLLSLIIVALLYVVPGSVQALEPVRVVVLPITVYAKEDLAYLASEIPKVIKKHLKEDGAVILEPDYVFSTPVESMTSDDFRRFGIKTGADYVVWGSMTRIGRQFSLDIKTIASFGEEPAYVAFKEGEKIETLPGIVKDLSRSLGLKIFKQEIVSEVRVTGNKRIEADAIERVIQTAPGGIFSAKDLSRDLKSIYSMGYFDDVRIEAEEGPKGKVIIFRVKEKATIRVIRFKGNKVYDDEKIMENLSLSTGSILNVFKLEKNVRRIETLYKEKNYHNTQVSYKIHPLANEQADLEFIIEESAKTWIKKIVFKGNRAYSEKKLKKMMKTAEKGMFSWITSSGDLSKEDLLRDADRIAAFYNNSGYIKAKVGEPEVEYKEDGIYVTFKIEEGPQFKVGKVDIVGDLVLPKEELNKWIKISKEEYYSREVIRNDLLALSDLYSDHGYAYADISPRIEQDFDNLVVDITYAIAKGKEVYFERISIDGNTITRDKVIRRELGVYEQELYSGVALKRGIQNLHRMDFFEDVKVNTEQGSTDDSMRLNINVTEKPTGAFSFGGGYSTDENLFGMVSVSQRNLFGRAQTLEVKAQVGGITNRYDISFIEPWLFDIPLSAGFDIYNWQTDYDEYDKDAVGFRMNFGYRIFDYTRASLGYNYEIADIKNIDADASNDIKELEGENTLSSIIAGLRYDSRDKIFNPTRGSVHRLTAEYAGLGGDFNYYKAVLDTGWYIPLFWETVGFIHGRTGYADEHSGGFLPDYEKFYLGGINSVRGFEWRGISLEDENGAAIGGDKFVQINLEFIFPLIKKAGFVGVLFYDMGNVYDKDDKIEFDSLREGVGFGFRWYSPMGPIRIENGYILNPRDGEDQNGRWEFSMGAAF